MFKKFLYLVFVLISFLGLNSCQKETENLHKVKFEIEFLNKPEIGVSNSVEILNCQPHYSEEEVRIYNEYITSGYIWQYEYWELAENQNIEFRFWCQNDYHFIMKVYIDDNLVSYKEMVGIDESGVNYHLVNQWGVNNGIDNFPEIEFTYYE